MRKLAAVAFVSLLGMPSHAEMGRKQKVALFIGVDVSASFPKSEYQDALAFLGHYIHGHLQGVGDLEPAKALFIGSIGGNKEGETKSFHPIEDFKGKSAETIEADLKAWFPRRDAMTDFNAFFESVSGIAKERNLSLTPIEVVLVTDGVPDGPGGREGEMHQIDLSSLEFLSRRVTLRVLYPQPTRCTQWKTALSRRRLRMWTVDDQVMAGWKNQFNAGVSDRNQTDLWSWVLNNVDYRVGPVKYRITVKK